MNKKILFFLSLITNILTHGMETSNNESLLNLYNPTILSAVTTQLCLIHRYKPQCIRKDIKSLSTTNTILHEYYHQEKNQQKIIRLCSRNLCSNDEKIAKKLRCDRIAKKIDYLLTITLDKQKQFTAQDLTDPWYLNCTIDSINRSLLYMAIDRLNLEKAQLIIQHSKELDFRYGTNQSLLLCITWHRRNKKLFISENENDNQQKVLISIAQSLLQKKIDPNRGATRSAPLPEAAFYNDKQLAQLLLEYNADPNKTYYDHFALQYRNAFSVEKGEPKGWLTTMFNNIRLIHFKYWILKHYAYSYDAFPQEIIYLIMQQLRLLQK